MTYNKNQECSQRAMRRNKRGHSEKKVRSTPAQQGSVSKHTTKNRQRVPLRKDYPTKPKDLDKRDKLKASRDRKSEFAHLDAACFEDLTHEWNLHSWNRDQRQDQDTHYFVTIDNVKKPYYGTISVCDGFETPIRYNYTSIRYNYDVTEAY